MRLIPRIDGLALVVSRAYIVVLQDYIILNIFKAAA